MKTAGKTKTDRNREDGEIPTPIEFLWSDTQGNSIYVKCDDMFGFQRGFPVSGSKVRIGLRYLQDMQDKGCDVLVSYGSRFSNMNSSLAYLAQKNGVQCHIIEPVQDTAGHYSENHWMAQKYGARYHYCRPWEIRNTVRNVCRNLENSGHKPYYIFGDETGKGNRGCAVEAYAEAFLEIRDWERRHPWHFDYIFLPTGTGITQAGLLAGHLRYDPHSDSRKIIGISISHSKDKAKEDIRGCLLQYDQEQGRNSSKQNYYPHCSYEDIIVLDEYRGGGYGIYDKDICDMIDRINSGTQIRLDPIYSGKAFYGMSEYLRTNYIENSRILFLHTGGSPNYNDYRFITQELPKRKKAALLMGREENVWNGDKAA